MKKTCNQLAKDTNVPCKDTISRQAAIDAAIKADMENNSNVLSEKRARVIDRHISAVPSAEPESLVNESRTLVNDLVNDTISRQAALEALSVGKELLSRVLDEIDVVGADREKYSWWLGLIEANIKDIEELPSAQPESSIPISWIEKQIDWLKSMDNGFSDIIAMNISVLVKKWRKENGKDDGSD